MINRPASLKLRELPSSNCLPRIDAAAAQIASQLAYCLIVEAGMAAPFEFLTGLEYLINCTSSAQSSKKKSTTCDEVLMVEKAEKRLRRTRNVGPATYHYVRLVGLPTTKCKHAVKDF